MFIFPVICMLAVSASMVMAAAQAGDGPYVTIRDHAFEPARITIPADTRVKLMVRNADTAPAEFESFDFRAEKVIPGGTELPVYIGPLEKGSYGFFNDFARDATGTLIVD